MDAHESSTSYMSTHYLPKSISVLENAYISIISIFHHFKIIIMKFNLKSYWREILIGILIALLLWVSSADKSTNTVGSSETVCVTDTITKAVPAPALVKYVKVKLPVYLRDTITDHKITDHYITDTAWLYADIPQNEYRDTNYYIRTIGWMDSISLFMPKCETIKQELPNYGNKVTIFGNTMMGNGVVAPGVSISVRKLQLGYNYNVINQSGVVTVGYRIR